MTSRAVLRCSSTTSSPPVQRFRHFTAARAAVTASSRPPDVSIVMAVGHASAVTAMRAAIAPVASDASSPARARAASRFLRDLDRRVATQFDEIATGFACKSGGLLTPAARAPGRVEDDGLAELEQGPGTVEQGAVGQRSHALVVETLAILLGRPCVVWPRPARSLRTSSERSTVHPSRSARPAASVDLPVPGSPPTSASTTRPRRQMVVRHLEELRGLVARPPHPLAGAQARHLRPAHGRGRRCSAARASPDTSRPRTPGTTRGTAHRASAAPTRSRSIARKATSASTSP